MKLNCIEKLLSDQAHTENFFFHLKFLEKATCLKVFVTCKYWWLVNIIFFLRRSNRHCASWRHLETYSTAFDYWHFNVTYTLTSQSKKSFDNVFDQITFFDSLVRCWHIHWDYLSAKVSYTNLEVTKTTKMN